MRLLAMIKKEFRQITRDVRTLFLTILMPSILLLLFGYALSFDVKHIKTGYMDQDQSNMSREFLSSLTAGEYFDLKKNYLSYSETERGLDTGETSVVVIIPKGFEEKLTAGEGPTIQSFIDGSNSQMATIIQGYVKAFTQAYSMKMIAEQKLRLGNINVDFPVTLEPRIWYNPELKSAMFLVPGLIVLILMITGAISTAVSVTREREQGTIEQLAVSPLNSAHIIFGKTVPYFFISLLSAFIIIVVGAVFFSVVVRGDYLLLLLSLVLFIFAALSQGILISTITTSQQVAFQVATLSAMLPSLLLSGFIFPIRNMPHVLQLITYIVPARYFVEVLRAILLRGVGIEAYYKELLALAGFALFMLIIASIKLKRTKWV